MGYNLVKPGPKQTGCLDKDDLRRQLPPVGFRMRKRPYAGHENAEQALPLAWCQVVYVNYRHLFYRVRFMGSGICECYKVPEGRISE